MTNRDERRWISAIRAGDAQAFELLYERCASRVAGFVGRFAADRGECEDIVQEVFLAAYAGRASYAGRSKPLAWLLGIAVRRCRDRKRKAALPLAEGADIDEIAAMKVCGRPVADIVVDSIGLCDALERLDPLFREALLLVGSQGLTYREAAEAMGEPVGTVKWRVSVAAAKMRCLLEPFGEETDGMQQANARPSLCSG